MHFKNCSFAWGNRYHTKLKFWFLFHNFHYSSTGFILFWLSLQAGYTIEKLKVEKSNAIREKEILKQDMVTLKQDLVGQFTSVFQLISFFS